MVWLSPNRSGMLWSGSLGRHLGAPERSVRETALPPWEAARASCTAAHFKQKRLAAASRYAPVPPHKHLHRPGAFLLPGS